MTKRTQSSRTKRRTLLRWFTSTLLMATLAFASVPPAIAASLAREAASHSLSMIGRFTVITTGWLIKKPRKRKRGTPQEPATSTGVRPQPPLTKGQREASVSSIRISPKDEITLESGKSMLFSALPLDRDGVDG